MLACMCVRSPARRRETGGALPLDPAFSSGIFDGAGAAATHALRFANTAATLTSKGASASLQSHAD